VLIVIVPAEVFLQKVIPGCVVTIQAGLDQPDLELCRKGGIRDRFSGKDGMRMSAACASYALDPDQGSAADAGTDLPAVEAPEDEVPLLPFFPAERTDERAGQEELLKEFQEIRISFFERFRIKCFFKRLENVYSSRYHDIT
jgi:hypothetical protein